jgi:hypothetical protein
MANPPRGPRGGVSQVNGEYAHFFTFRRIGDGKVEGNILTAAYTEPLQQERLFIKSPTRPILVYSHRLSLERDE